MNNINVDRNQEFYIELFLMAGAACVRTEEMENI